MILKLLSLIYLLALIVLSMVPLSGVESPGNTDKIAHFIVYAILGAMAYFISGSFKQRIYLFLSIIALGAVLELVQYLIPGRSFSYLDMAANLAGTLFGFGISWMFKLSKQTPSFGGCGSPQTTVPVKNLEDQGKL